MGHRLLIVEEPIVAMDIGETLGDIGYTVAAVANSVELALNRVARTPIDAAVLDVRIGNEATYPVADELAWKGVPFLLSSFDDRDSLPVHLRDRPLIQKPYHAPGLVIAMMKLTGLYPPQRDILGDDLTTLREMEKRVGEGESRIERIERLLSRHPSHEGSRLLSNLRVTLDMTIRRRDQIRRILGVHRR